jgi:3-oxoacyl-[acyl-carrier protein] reductase
MKHVVVTGGSRGLGAAVVKGLLKDGYRVSSCSRNRTATLDGMIAEFPDRFFWSACNVGEAEEVDRFVRAAMDWAGADGVWGLVNNAGIAGVGILATFSNADSERILKVNLLGALQMARAVSQHLLRAGAGGRIVNMSSIIGTRGYNGLAAYSASKAGMDGLTRALARELGRRQITVNSVAPGYVKTDMSATLSEGQLAQIVKRTPLGRLATEDDVVNVVRFLLSDQAAFVTGETILVDGGISC